MDPKKAHSVFLGETPGALAVAFYESTNRGFSSKALDIELFTACFIKALSSALDADGSVRETYILIPPTHQAWVYDQLAVVAKRMFRPFEGATPEANRSIYERLASGYKMLRVGSRVHQMTEPARWVSFGFNRVDAIPEWIRTALFAPVVCVPDIERSV